MKRQTHICSAMFVADYVAMGLPLPRLCQCPYRTGPNGSCDIEFWALRTKRFSAGVMPGVCTSQHVMRVVRPYGSLKQHKIRLWKVTRSNGKKAFATRAVIRFFRLMREKRTQQQLELYMSTLPLGHKVLRSRWDAIASPSSQTSPISSSSPSSNLLTDVSELEPANLLASFDDVKGDHTDQGCGSSDEERVDVGANVAWDPYL